MCSKCFRFIFCCCYHHDSEDFDTDELVKNESLDNLDLVCNQLQAELEQKDNNFIPYLEIRKFLGIIHQTNEGIYADRGFQNNFYYLYCSHIKQRINKTLSKEPVGWKFHISIARDEVNMTKAWKILQAVAGRYRLTHIKVPYPEHLSRLKNGKEFCCYLFKNEHIENWYEIFNIIEKLFILNQVMPNEEFSLADKKIKGSKYLCYRNDQNPNDETYISAAKALAMAEQKKIPAYNLVQQQDPFEGVQISNNQQQAIVVSAIKK